MLHELVLLHEWPTSVLIFTAFGCSLLLWRFWRFTVQPWLYPSLPIELPYWIPCHTYAFFWRSDELMERGLSVVINEALESPSLSAEVSLRNYTRRTHEPYAIQLAAGKKLYVITAPRDVTDTFDNTSGLDYDSHLSDLLESFGLDEASIKIGWHQPRPGDWCHIPNNPINPRQLCLIKWVQNLYRESLLNSSRMDEMCNAFLKSMLASLQVAQLEKCNLRHDGIPWATAGPPRKVALSELMRPVKLPSKGTTFMRVSLFQLVRQIMVEAAAQSMFGNHLHDIEPETVEIMLTYNDHAWMTVFRYPDIFHRYPVHSAHKTMVAALKKLVQLPESERKGVSWLANTTIKGMQNTAMSVDSQASMMFMIFWATVSNEYSSCFWTLSYILHDESLLELVKQETEAAWHSGVLDIRYLCANCPHLEAAFNETLRTKNAAQAVRTVTHEIEVGGKLLQPGNLVMIPFRQLHYNEDVWGSKVDEFDPTRFLKRKALTRNASFRPFGGGATYCPGRTLAKQEVYGLVAILFHRFDIELTQHPGMTKQPFPRLNTGNPSVGFNGPVDGDHVTVDLTEKRSQFGT